MERPGEIYDALKQAKDCGRTCLVEVMVDPEECALPMIPSDPKEPLVKGRCPFGL